MAKIVIMDHPLIKHKIGLIRRKEIGTKEFRETIGEIAMLECYEATRNLELEDVDIETPLCQTTVQEIKGKKLAVVPILRAGLGMVDGMLTMIPAAKVGHIGLYRDPETLAPVEYYCKLPADCAEREIFVVPCLPQAVPLWRQSRCSKSTAARSFISFASSLLPKASRPSRKLIPTSTSTSAHWMITSTTTATSFPDWATLATGSLERSDPSGAVLTEDR